MKLWPLFLAFMTTALLCPLLARLAPALRLVDLPDARKQHAGAVPLVGGLAALAGFVLAAALGGQLRALGEVAGPMALLFAVGLVDDIFDLRASFKLAMQLLAGWWLVHNTGAALFALPLPFMAGHLALGAWAVPLTVLMVVLIVNALNMIDGLDGLAGGCIAVAAAALGAAAMLAAEAGVAAIAALLCAAALGFLVWNARFPWQARARVFLGDAGALAIGLLLCWLMLRLSLVWIPGRPAPRVPLTVGLAPLAVPVLDLIVVAFWRMAEGRNPMAADRGHSHHLLLEMGLSTVGAVRLLWCAAAAIALATFAAWRLGVAEGRLLGVLVAGSLAYLVWFRVSWLRVRKASQKPSPPAPLPQAGEGSGKRVLFVVTGLGVGGAERSLERLLPRLVEQGLAVAVVSLREPQPVGESLRALGIEVHELGMAPSRPSLAGLFGLWRVVRAFRPDVIQGWLYHGDLAAQAARLAAPRAKVVLGIHQTLARLELESRATRAVIRLDALLSRFAAKLIYVAQAAVPQHEAAGFARRAVVLPNAVDTELFRPDPAARAATRVMLGLSDGQVLIGMVGRHHPAKNHEGFLQAAAILAAEHPEVRFLLCGLDVTPDNPALAPWLSLPALAGKVFALGPRSDVPALLAGCDLYVLSSIQEALPNVVAEAMSCGLPCVVTDVGDAGRMIGDTGWLSPFAEGEPLADLIGQALREGPSALALRGRAARTRAQSHFAADAVARRYAELYRTL